MLKKYYRITKASGIAIHVRNNGEPDIQLCIVAASGDKLDIEKKIGSISNVEQIKQHVPPKALIAVNLTGKGILNKQVARLEVVDQRNFNKILPNGNFNDFYIQNFISGESSFVSLIRKQDADGW